MEVMDVVVPYAADMQYRFGLIHYRNVMGGNNFKVTTVSHFRRTRIENHAILTICAVKKDDTALFHTQAVQNGATEI
jgi:hypothetical protein